MNLSKRAKILIGVAAIITVVVAGTSVAAFSLMNANSIRINLLYNAGVMIEHQGIRIYIDPIELPASYDSLPADAILTTHDHGDHYLSSTMNRLQKEGTVNVFPAIMTAAISLHNGVGIEPGDTIQVGHITITAFYMYTYAPTESQPASHPIESGYTSYIININGFTLFHAGDSKNIPEYSQLTGLIDVAFLPLGPGCQTMFDQEVVDALDVIQPRYFIPIHYAEGTNFEWINTYGPQVSNCQIINLAYWQTHPLLPN